MIDKEATAISGTVCRIFYCNPDGPWMAGKVELDDGEVIGFAGKVAADVGDLISCTGRWAVHPIHGDQFDVATGLVKMDESPDALVHLLASHDDFKGLGPVRARRVVDAAMSVSVDGEVASALIAYPEEIAARSDVSVDVVRNASEVWGKRKSYFDALGLLADQGWSGAQSIRIVERLGENAPALVGDDPYQLIGRIPRFGFRTVDVVAKKMGVLSTDPKRLSSGLAFCLDRISQEGNTYTTRVALVQDAVEELRPDTLEGEDLIATILEQMVSAGLVMADVGPDGVEFVADARLASIEIRLMEWLTHALSSEIAPQFRAFGYESPRAKLVMATLNKAQKAAALGVWLHEVSVISGGAGVGKTYMINALCDIAEENGLRVKLCAPTGKAARKMESATQREAKTIHRLLEPKFDRKTGEFSFLRNMMNPIEADIIIVDEISMVDVRLMNSLLNAKPQECRLVLVGDHNQIPSVGPGAILRDLLSIRDRHPGAIHVLTDIVRQAGQLARNTTALLDGVVSFEEIPAWGVVRTERGSENGAAGTVAEIVDFALTTTEPMEPFARTLDAAWDVQVLSPQRKGPLGTYALNVQLQAQRQRMLGNGTPEPTPADKAPKPLVGDRIIWTKNDSELDLFNGTQALVSAINKNGTMDIRTEDGRKVKIPASKRVCIEVAYAMTVHKSQGSEWPMVILICSTAHTYMHDRNLFYTGASRAAEALTIVGDVGGIKHFATQMRSSKRATLGSFIVAGWEPARSPDARDAFFSSTVREVIRE